MQPKHNRLLALLTFLSLCMAGAFPSMAAGKTLQSPEADTTWERILSVQSPSARYVHGMSYDSSRGVMVLFGGDGTGKQRLNDTWEFDGSNWVQVQAPSGSPPGRVNISQAMVYDSYRHKTVLFGGLARAGYMNDTWEYDGSTWSQINTLDYPPGRDAHAMVYDSYRHVTVLFGGYSPTNSFLNDTWEYDGSNWHHIYPPQSPPGRHHFGMAYDSLRHVIVLFGGHGATSPQMSDTWEYDGSTWRQVTTAQSPSPREDHSMAYDAQLGVVVLFGGTNNGVNPLDDTWEYNGTDWSHASPTISPSARLGFPLAYDSIRGKVVLFGGGYWTSRLQVNRETWEYGLDSGAANGILQEARLDGGMPYDIYRGCASPYVGCGEPYHGFRTGVSTDVVLDAFKFGADFNIKRELDQDMLANPGRYLYGTPRYAEDLYRYFSQNQQLLPHSQPYLPGDIAFFDWNRDGITDNVSIVTQIDGSGRPLAMVDAMGLTAGNPGGSVVETGWTNYFEQHVESHARLGLPLTSLPSAPTADIQVLRLRLVSPAASMRLQDDQGKSVSREYDENLVASNIQDFIPYIPMASYAEVGTHTLITVTNPLSNGSQYYVDLSSPDAVTYTLHIETLQNGIVTDETTYNDQDLPAGGSQRVHFSLTQPAGMLEITNPSLDSAPTLQVPGELAFSSLGGMTAAYSFAISETQGTYPLQNALLTPTELRDQMGATIPASRLTLTPADFSLPPGGSQVFSLQVDLAGINPGLYQGDIQLTSGNSSPAILRVSLMVDPHNLFLPMLRR